MTATLSGCATMTDSGATTDRYFITVPCQAFAPLSWSTADTDKTLRGIKIHNAVWRRLCLK
jgi:hypothetical protein